VRMKGKLVKPNNPTISVIVFESGDKLIWCDHTINRVLERIE